MKKKILCLLLLCSLLGLCCSGCALGEKLTELLNGVSEIIESEKGEPAPTGSGESSGEDQTEVPEESTSSEESSSPAESLPAESRTEPEPQETDGLLACCYLGAEKRKVCLTPDENGETAGYLFYGSPARLLESVTVNGKEWLKIESGELTGYAPAADFCSGAAAQTLIESQKREVAEIISGIEALRLRAKADTDSATVGLLEACSRYTVLGHDGAFVRLRISDEVTGFVPADQVTLQKEENTGISAEEARAQEEEGRKLLSEQRERELESSIAESAAASLAESLKESAEASRHAETASEPFETDDGQLHLPEGLSENRRSICETAYACVGKLPYRYGGQNLNDGVDSSGLIVALFRAYGISLPQSTKNLRSCGTEVPYAYHAQPGDVICYSGSVGLYIGNGQIIRAGSEVTQADGSVINYPVAIDSMYYKDIITVRNIFGD